MANRTNWALTAIAVALAGLAWYQGGPQLAWAGLEQAARTLWRVIPLLIAAFLVAGFVQALATQEAISRWLGAGSGWRGIALACVGGALMPGGPYVYYPIAAALLQGGAGLGVLVAFIAAKNLWSVSRLPLEVALLGPELTLIRFALTLIAPPLLGFVAEATLGARLERIREGAPL